MGSGIFIEKVIKYFSNAVSCRIQLYFKVILLNFIIALSSWNTIIAQDKFTEEKPDPSFLYDEIPVRLFVEGVGSFNLDVIYTTNEELYIKVEDLFKPLSIPCIVAQQGDSLGGFIGNENRSYSIDFNKNEIRIKDKIYQTQGKIVKEMGAIYLESSLFAEAFGIVLTFNFRALTINLKSDFELPVLKQQRLEK